LLAVDVDSGAGARDLAACNLAAAAEIARQMRIRNSAGVIVVDFIESGPDDRRALDRAFRGAVRADRSGCRIAGFGPLGLYELTRRRLGPPLAASWPAS
jgi:Rne/Rng family ribonuclease